MAGDAFKADAAALLLGKLFRYFGASHVFYIAKYVKTP